MTYVVYSFLAFLRHFLQKMSKWANLSNRVGLYIIRAGAGGRGRIAAARGGGGRLRALALALDAKEAEVKANGRKRTCLMRCDGRIWIQQRQFIKRNAAEAGKYGRLWAIQHTRSVDAWVLVIVKHKRKCGQFYTPLSVVKGLNRQESG
jgi:hypothetical protein